MNIDTEVTNATPLAQQQQQNSHSYCSEPVYDNEQEDSYDDDDSDDDDDDDDSDDDDDDDCGANDQTQYGERLLIYADKFIRNELLTIMECIKNRDKDLPAEEVVVHEIYL